MYKESERQSKGKVVAELIAQGPPLMHMVLASLKKQLQQQPLIPFSTNYVHHTTTCVVAMCRLAVGSSGGRPVKIRRVDDDTHVVYTPTPHA
jgi:hypothetical protein